MNTLPILRPYRNDEVDIYMNQGATDMVEGVTGMTFDNVVSGIVSKVADVDLEVTRKQHAVNNTNGGPSEIEGVSLRFIPVKGAGLDEATNAANSVDAAIKECVKVQAKQKSGKEYDHEAFISDLFS